MAKTVDAPRKSRTPAAPADGSPTPRLPARERLLAAAEQLFYQEGFNVVGIDRVIEVAGVAKASLYDNFGSKEELIKAYLTTRIAARQRLVEPALAQPGTPRERLMAVLAALSHREPGFKGCAFVKAGAEARPGSSVLAVCDEWRRWLHELLEGLVRDCGVADAATLARQLVMLHDGASVSANLDRDSSTAQLAQATASTLLDLALARELSRVSQSTAG